MNDQPSNREARGRDRLPDVRPPRDGSRYSAFGGGAPSAGSDRAPAPDTFDEPAWWEHEPAARLPNARHWRATSIVSAHLPRPLRLALDRESPRSDPGSSGWSFDDRPDRVLGGSRLGPEDEIPVLSDDEIARERASWRDEGSRETGKRGKRPKAGRKDRRGDGSGRPQGRSR